MKLFFVVVLCHFFSTLAFASAVYQQPCHTMNEDDYVQFSIESDSLESGAALQLKVIAFEDEECQVPYLTYTRYFKVQNFLDEKINLITEKVSYTAMSDETAESLNIIKYCSQDSWKNHAEVDVTGQNCQDYVQLSQGSLFFQILKYTDVGLQLGEITSSLDGRSELKRPQKFDQSNYLKL